MQSLSANHKLKIFNFYRFVFCHISLFLSPVFAQEVVLGRFAVLDFQVSMRLRSQFTLFKKVAKVFSFATFNELSPPIKFTSNSIFFVLILLGLKVFIDQNCVLSFVSRFYFLTAIIIPVAQTCLANNKSSLVSK